MNKKKINYKILLPLIIILIIGIYMVYSSSKIWADYLYNDAAYYLKRQLFFVSLGFVLLIVGYKIDLYKIKKHSNILLLFSIVLLALFIGLDFIN